MALLLHFNEPYFRDLDGPLPPSDGKKTSFIIIQCIWCALTSCCSLKTPREQNLCHCHSSCPQTHCHGTHCRATRCHGILSRSHSSRCSPSPHPRVKVGAAASCHHAGSPARPGARGCCRSPRRPVRRHPARHNPRCNRWPCGEVGWWCRRESAPLPPPGSRPFPGSDHARPELSTGSALDHCPQTCDGPKGKTWEIRLSST